jgi:hypothetical protein
MNAAERRQDQKQGTERVIERDAEGGRGSRRSKRGIYVLNTLEKRQGGPRGALPDRGFAKPEAATEIT